MSEWLWVADAANLRRYDGVAWTSAPLPPPLNTPAAMVLGLATDRFGTVVWLHAKNETLWVYDSAAGTFTQKR